MRWEPAIYEHKAALIGRSPQEVANNAELLTAAVNREVEVYNADFVTVGLDVYNIEAEACGARLICPDSTSCPEVAEPLWALSDLPETLALPAVPESGRFTLMLDAGQRCCEALSERTHVRVAASGPATIATKLVGLEALVMSLVLEDAEAVRLLDFCTELAAAWCAALRDADLDVVLFDSAASPPMFSPAMYRTFVRPRHARLMGQLAAAGQSHRPLILGGDTVPIAADLAATGANMLVCDFAADAAAFAEAVAACPDIEVRRNVNPAALLGDDAAITAAARQLTADLAHFRHPVAGTGILPYDFDPARFRRLQSQVDG